jgi:hypothetical protein
MKFWISAALNLTLAAVIAVLLLRRPEAGHATAPATGAKRPEIAAPVSPAPESSAAMPARANPKPDADGIAVDLGGDRHIEFSPQFVGLLKMLQEAGMSERSLVNFVTAEFGDQWWAAQQSIQRKFRRGEITPAEQQRFFIELEEARNAAIKSLLGEPALAQWRRDNLMRWAQTAGLNLTPQQADAVGEAYKQFGTGGHRARELSAAMQSGEIDQFDFQEQQTAMQKQFEEKLTALLGAQGYADLKRGSDWQYGNTRRQLKDLSLTDAQFDEFYDTMQRLAQKQQELQRESRGDRPKDFSQQFAALQQEQEKEAQRLLGAQGYEQLQKLQDHRYQQLTQFAPAWQLTKADIEHVYDAVQQAGKELEEYRKQARSTPGQPVDWKEINLGIEDYKRQAEDDLRRYLGEERFTKLKRAGLLNFEARSNRGVNLMRYFPGQSSFFIPNY